MKISVVSSQRPMDSLPSNSHKDDDLKNNLARQIRSTDLPRQGNVKKASSDLARSMVLQNLVNRAKRFILPKKGDKSSYATYSQTGVNDIGYTAAETDHLTGYYQEVDEHDSLSVAKFIPLLLASALAGYVFFLADFPSSSGSSSSTSNTVRNGDITFGDVSNFAFADNSFDFTITDNGR